MRTLRLILLVMLVVALPVATATAATGKGKPPTTTTTTTAPQPTLGGYTCAQSGYDQSSHELAFTESGFSFTLNNDAMCVDVLHGRPGVWTVTVTGVQGRVNRLLLVPRDSFGPGDSCGGADLRQPDLTQPIELPLPVDPRHGAGIPAATVNACGTQFGEWIGGVLEAGQTGAPHPLAFFAMLEGVKGAHATITVTLP